MHSLSRSTSGLAVVGMVVGSLLTPQTATAHGDTIHLFFDQGRPSIGLLSEADGSITPQSSFAGTWNWNTFQNSFFSSSPGWSYDAQWDFTDDLTFRIVTSLQRWNGAGFVDAAYDVRMTFAIWSVTSGPGITGGFPVTLGSNDHFHYGYSLAGVPNTPAANGVYRVNLQAARVRSGRATWFPVFSLVLNRGESTATAANALAYSNGGRLVVMRENVVAEIRPEQGEQPSKVRRP